MLDSEVLAKMAARKVNSEPEYREREALRNLLAERENGFRCMCKGEHECEAHRA